MTITEKQVTSAAEVYMDEDEIVRMVFPVKNTKIVFEDSEEIYNARMELPNAGSKQRVLVDLRTNPKPNREARDYAKNSKVVNSTQAMALIVGGPLSKILGNFFIGFNRGDFPVRLFASETEAITWLKKN